MTIILDAMGGDFAPLACVKGALLAREKYGADILLCGQPEAIRAALRESGKGALPPGVGILPAGEVIGMEDDPATAFKRKPDSSMTVGLTCLRDGEADAFVSAGSTGALLAGATLLVRRIRGIRRAALAPVIPSAEGRFVLLDCGANAVCTAEYLLQFAWLGSFYAERVLGVPRPRVALLNIGAEESKGDPLRREAYRLLSDAELHFVGNLEAKDALLGGCDVLVADGFSGNVLLKSLEGTAKLMSAMLKEALYRNAGTKLAALALRGGLTEMRRAFDADEVGGTALLGIAKPVIKAHGSSGDRAICAAIGQAIETAQGGVAEEIARNAGRLRVTGGTGPEEG